MPAAKTKSRSGASKKKAPAKKKRASSVLKSTASKRPAKRKLVAEKIHDPEPTPAPPMPGPENDKECQTCSHMPIHTGALVGALVAVIAILSVVVIGSTIIIDSQSFVIHAANSGGAIGDAVLGR